MSGQQNKFENVSKVIYFGTLINHNNFHGNKIFLTFMQSVLPFGNTLSSNAKLKTLVIKTNTKISYTVLFACGTWALSYRWGWVQMCSGTGTILFGHKPPYLQYLHLSHHLVGRVKTTSTQLRPLFHCYQNENFLYIISPTPPPAPAVPLDTVCITLELLMARYRTNLSTLVKGRQHL